MKSYFNYLNEFNQLIHSYRDYENIGIIIEYYHYSEKIEVEIYDQTDEENWILLEIYKIEAEGEEEEAAEGLVRQFYIEFEYK